MKARPLIGGLVAGACLLSLAHAAAVRRGAVEAELVSAVSAIQPGRPLTVAIRLRHDRGWHTYGRNAGEGYATTVRWHLPPGWRAGDIQWPVPRVLRTPDGAIIGDGYTGEVFLLATLTPPADLVVAQPATVSATVHWLMARDEPQPAAATLTLSLPVTAGPARPDPVWGPRLAGAFRHLPQSSAGWRASAAPAGRFIRLTLRAPAEIPFDSSRLHFFADPSWIAFDQPQRVRRQGRYLTLDLPIAGPLPESFSRLDGVLAMADGSGPAFRVDVPLATAPAAPTPVQAAAAAAGVRTATRVVLLVFGCLALSLLSYLLPLARSKIVWLAAHQGASGAHPGPMLPRDGAALDIIDPRPPIRVSPGRKG